MAPWRCRRCSTKRCGSWCHRHRPPPRGTAPRRRPRRSVIPLQRQPARERAARAVPRPAPDAAGAQCLAGVPPAAQERWRDGVPHLRPAPALPASMPCAAQASHETVARALTLLRLTRWLSLATAPRPEDRAHPRQPLRAARRTADALRGDAARPRLPGPGQPGADPCREGSADRRHEHPREIAEDPMLNGRTPPTRLQVLAQRMARNEWADTSYPQEPVDHESEEGQAVPLRNLNGRLRNPEAGLKPALDGSLGIRRRTVLYVWIV